MNTLVLEHAAGGSLLDHFRENDFPYKAEDIKALWTSFLGAAKGIETIQQQFKGGYARCSPFLAPLIQNALTDHHTLLSPDFMVI